MDPLVNGQPLDCEAARPLLDLHAGDDLDGRERLAVEAHLRSCLQCFRDYSELRALLVTVRAASAGESRSEAIGETIVSRVMSAIHGPPPAMPRLLPRLLTASGWAAAALLAATLGFQALAGRATAPKGPGGVMPQIVEGDGSADGMPFRSIGNERWRPGEIAPALERQFDELQREAAAGATPRRVTPSRPVGARRNM